ERTERIERNSQYRVLARGFKPEYNPNKVLERALKNYQTRWLRLCLYEDRDYSDFLQACHQWCLSVMQYFILKRNYIINSLLSISFLGNTQFTLNEFCRRFRFGYKDYFRSIIRASKGYLKEENFERPNIFYLVDIFRVISAQEEFVYSSSNDILLK